MWLELDRPFGVAGLTDGDTIHVGSFAEIGPVVAATTSEPGAIEVWIHGGPRAGEHFQLAPGTHTVGRDRRFADVVVADDPSLSKRHLELHLSAEGVHLADLSSANGTFIDGLAAPPDQRVAVAEGALVEAGRSAFSWRPAARGDSTRLSGDVGDLHVRRPPRVRSRWEAPKLELAAPPDDPRRARIPILASLVPLALGVILYAITGIVLTLLISLIAPVVAIASRMEDRFGGARDFRGRARKFSADLSGVTERLSAAVADETIARRAESPDAAVLLRRITDPSGDLWVRRRGDDDFLDLRVGSADQPSRSTVSFATGGNSDLRASAQTEIDALRISRSVPVIVPLGKWGSLGVVGPADGVDRLTGWLVLQAAIYHAPSELDIKAVVGPGRLQAWNWLKWLPHAQRPDVASIWSSARRPPTSCLIARWTPQDRFNARGRQEAHPAPC